MLQFVDPSIEYIDSFIEALREGPFSHMAVGGFGDTNANEVSSNPQEYLEALTSRRPRNIVTPSGHTFVFNDHEIIWITDGRRFLGAVSLRYDQDCELIDLYCGHVGLSIRAALLNKGYGARATRQGWIHAASRAREKELPELLMSCDPDNHPSRKLILDIGGKLVRTSDPFGYGLSEMYELQI